MTYCHRAILPPAIQPPLIDISGAPRGRTCGALALATSIDRLERHDDPVLRDDVCVHARAEDRGLRYLEWVHPHDPATGIYRVDYVWLLREGDAPARVVHDTHIEGLFPRATWLRLLTDAGFTVHSATRPVEADWTDEIFVCVRP